MSADLLVGVAANAMHGPTILTLNISVYNEHSLSKNDGIFHCVQSVRIQSFSGPYFAAFRMNMRMRR